MYHPINTDQIDLRSFRYIRGNSNTIQLFSFVDLHSVNNKKHNLLPTAGFYISLINCLDASNIYNNKHEIFEMIEIDLPCQFARSVGVL